MRGLINGARNVGRRIVGAVGRGVNAVRRAISRRSASTTRSRSSGS